MPRDYKQESLRHFDRIAGRYDSHRYGKQTRKIHELVVRVIDGLNPGSLLDVGCGNGGFLSFVQNETRVLAGADLSPKMIHCAEQRFGHGVELKIADAERLPWPAENFDCLTCNYSFHHYPNPQAVLKEFHRVIKPAGYLILTDPWFPAPLRFVANFLLHFTRLGDVRMYSFENLCSFAESAHFRVVRIDHARNSSLLVAQKV